MMIRSNLLSTLAVALLLAFAACGDDDDPVDGGNTDTTPPGVAAVTPVDLFHVDVSFNEAVSKSSAEDESNYTLTEGATPAPVSPRGTNAAPGDPIAIAGITLQNNGTTVTITTESSMAGLPVDLTVDNVSDAHGNGITSPIERSFTGSIAADETAPQIVRRNPAPNAVNVPIGTAVTVQFSEAVTSADFAWTSPSGPVPFSTQPDGTTFTLIPEAALATNALQTITLQGVQDASGNTMTESEWSFTTTTATDNTPPTLVSTSPANNATNVDVNANLSLTFSEAVNQTQLNATLVPDPGLGVLTWTNGGKTVTFDPVAPLIDDQQYTLSIFPGGVLDLAGNSIQGVHTRVFTTGATLESGSIAGTIIGHPGSEAADPTGATVVVSPNLPDGDEFDIVGSTVVAANNTYKVSHLPDGEYFVIAILPTSDDSELNPDGGDAIGGYGVDFITQDFEPDSVVVSGGNAVTGITFQLYDPSAVTGTVTYNGVNEGSYYAYIGLFSAAGFDPNNPGEPVAFGDAFWPEFPQWRISSLDQPIPMGDYFVGAFLDVTVNGALDSDEPRGLYGGISPQSIHIMNGSDFTGLVINLVDPAPPGSATSAAVAWSNPGRRSEFQRLLERVKFNLSAKRP